MRISFNIIKLFNSLIFKTMAKKRVIRKSIRDGIGGPKLKLQLFIDGKLNFEIILNAEDTEEIYHMIYKARQKKKKNQKTEWAFFSMN